MKKGIITPVILVIVAIGMVAVVTIAYFQFKPKLSPQTQSPWASYESKVLGFSLKYPPGYEMNEEKLKDIVISVIFKTTDYAYEDGIGDGYIKKGGVIKISVYENKFSLIKDVHAEYAPKNISQTEQTIDGVKGTYIIMEHLGGEKSHDISLKRGTRVTSLQANFAGRDEKRIVSDFQQVLSTFKFLD